MGDRVEATVVVPTFNRREKLLASLDRLAQQDHVAGWEVVVVDDGSTDGTDEAVRGWIGTVGIRARYLRQENAGPAAARNRGAAAARGDILIFIDDDILVGPEFVRHHVGAVAANPGCWIVGRVVQSPQLASTPFGRFWNAVWESYHPIQGVRRLSEQEGLTAQHLSLPAQQFRMLGGFDEGFAGASCEDMELGLRARRAGLVVLYDPSVVVVHDDWPIDLATFCIRQRRYSTYDPLLWKKYGPASPRAAMIAGNAAVSLRDTPPVMAKKLGRRIVGTRAGHGIVCRLATTAERVAPDSRCTRWWYRVAISGAIFQGVREGMRRFDANGIHG